jgi:Tfp pilus assembly protein PilX
MLLKRLSPNRRTDEGSALIGVLALMLVTAIIGVTITTAAVHGLSVTSSTRAGVQARAAAEAGVDVAVAELQKAGSCDTALGIYESSTVPRYRATIHYDVPGGWTPGCPPATATQVRILSTGFAEATGVASASSGNKQIVEAVYNYIPDYVTIPDIDAAVYAHAMQGSLKNFDLDSADNNLSADLQIKNGNVNCINGARIAGDVILGNGSATLKNCEVTGSIHVSKNVIADGASRVFGDVIAAGQGIAAGTDVVTVKSGSTVDGDIYSGGNASILSGSASLAKANVTVAGTTSSVAKVASGSTVQGNVISSGTVSKQGTVGGTVSPAVEGLEPPPTPQIPDWTDVPYPSATWAANGYSEFLWTGTCIVSSGNPVWEALSARTTPTVVNALSCGADGLTTASNVGNLTLNANIAFIAHKFTIDKLYAASNDTTNRNLWFIVPDNTANGVPTCTAPSGDIYLHNEANIKPEISAMAYTPCKVYSDRDGWRGQIYGGEVEFGQQAKLTFAPVGIPGVDFSGGVPPTVALAGGHLGNRVSVRELGSGG